MQTQNKKAFSFVEIIITISIIVLLAVVGWNSKISYDENMFNTKVLSDTNTINNALIQFGEENSSLPMPGGNTNFYTIDTSYSHSYDDEETYGVYGSLTEETVAKKYLDVLPLDPRTNSYYSYGKTKESNEFEIASVQILDGEPVAQVIGDYSAEVGPYNLIREYNGPNFVFDGSKANLPYNPDDLIMIVTDENGVVYREGDTIKVQADGKVLKNNSDTGTNSNSDGIAGLELYFSDGSVSILDNSSEVTLNSLNFKADNNLSTFVKLSLGVGSIWTKATNLNDDSEFEVYTTDSTASVRGTIFGVIKDINETETVIVEGIVEVSEQDSTQTPSTGEYEKENTQSTLFNNSLETKTEIISVNKGDEAQSITTRSSTTEEPKTFERTPKSRDSFKKSENVRTGTTQANIQREAEEKESTSTVITRTNNNCSINGQTIKHGVTIATYLKGKVPYGGRCEAARRTCNDGTLSGDSNYSYLRCEVEGAVNCDAGTIDESGREFSYNAFNHTNYSKASLEETIVGGIQKYVKDIYCENGTVSFVNNNIEQIVACDTNDGFRKTTENTCVKDCPEGLVLDPNTEDSTHNYKLTTGIRAGHTGTGKALHEDKTSELNDLGKVFCYASLRCENDGTLSEVENIEHNEYICNEGYEYNDDTKLCERNCLVDSQGNCIASSLNGWNLVAYAAYNSPIVSGGTVTKSSYDFITKPNYPITTNQALYVDHGEDHSSSYIKNSNGYVSKVSPKPGHNFYNVSLQSSSSTQVTGIYFDRIHVPDTLEYQLPSSLFANDFAIEMNVRGYALKRTNATYVLFNINNYARVYQYNSQIKFVTTSGNSFIDVSNINDNDFYKVIFYKEGGINYITFNNITSNKITSPTTNSNQFFVGMYDGRTTPFTQWGDIIDYVKIYTK